MDLIRRIDYDKNTRQPIAIAFMNELSPNCTKHQELEFVLQVSQTKVLILMNIMINYLFIIYSINLIFTIIIDISKKIFMILVI